MSLWRWIIFSLTLLLFLSCSPKKSDPGGPAADTPPAPEGDGSKSYGGSTNIGGGGNGLEAEWKYIAQELEKNLRRLVVSHVDATIFKKIRSQLPELIQKAKIEFKDYPLILGTELSDQDNPSNLKTNPSTQCEQVLSEKNLEKERDAINFKDSVKIKVSRQRFQCYATQSMAIKRLVLHEYLGLLGIYEKTGAQTDYKVTNLLLAEMDKLDTVDSGLEKVEVKTCDDVQKIGLDPKDIKVTDQFEPWEFPEKRWILMSDLDCTSSRQWDDGRGFKARVLNGVFDGNGFKISNLYLGQRNEITGPTATVVSTKMGRITALQQPAHMTALFSYVCTRCSIVNLQLENADFVSQALLVVQNSGRISNVRVSGKIRTAEVTKTTWDVELNVMAGLVSYNYGTIKNTSADVDISNPRISNVLTSMGGLVGNNLGIIVDSSATSRIIGEGIVGGLVGDNQGAIQNSSAKSNITSRSVLIVGGLVGANRPTGSIIKSSSTGKIEVKKFEKALPSAGVLEPRIPFGGLVGDNSGTVSESTANVEICGNFSGMPKLYNMQLEVESNPLVTRTHDGGSVVNSNGNGKTVPECPN
tara:strand:+ start:33849 stop:35603 length:1755 start_codon:yes stop_codon:yes gene_type:complete